MTESKSSKNDELLTMLEDMQDEIEHLRSENKNLQNQLKQEASKKNEISSKEHQTISDLSSQVSALKKKVQSQKQEIVSLNEYIETLSKSDLQLKEALSMKSAAQEAIDTSSKLVTEYKETFEEWMYILDKRENDINKKEKRVNMIESDLEGEINKRVNSEVSKIEDDLEITYRKRRSKLGEDYRILTAKHQLGYYVLAIVTLFSVAGAIVTSKSLRKETKAFLYGFYRLMRGIILFPYWTGTFLARLGFNESASPVPYWIMSIVIMLILYGVMLVIIVKIVVFLIENIAECLCDGATVVVLAIILSMIIFLAPVLSEIPINILLAGFILFVIYMNIRFLMACDLQDQKKQNLLMVIIIIVSTCVAIGLMKLV